MNISGKFTTRVALGALLGLSMVGCGTAIAGQGQADAAGLAAAVQSQVGAVPTEIPTEIPTEAGEIPEVPTEAGEIPEEEPTDAGEVPEEEPTDAGEVPEEEPTDSGDTPADPDVEFPDFGSLPEGWPADVVLPPDSSDVFAFEDETGKYATFSVTGSTAEDVGGYFESSLGEAGYSLSDPTSFSGIYSATFTKDSVTVLVSFIDDGAGNLFGTVQVTGT